MVASQRRKRKLPFVMKEFRSEQAHGDVLTLYRLLPGVSPQAKLDGPPTGDASKSANVDSARLESLRSNFLKKYPGFAGYTPREAAKSSFLSYEERCRETNRKLRSLRSGAISDATLNADMLSAQRLIGDLLGSFNVDELLDSSRWGPGSTTSVSGPNVSSAAKFAAVPDVTCEFLGRARLLMPCYPAWSSLLAGADQAYVCPLLNLVDGNKITFVPKTAKTHRTIAIEPHINSFFQLGLGRMIRKRLKRRGVDLDDQSTNRSLAQLGSRDNSLATIDLEGASDTICTELVRDLLPEPWFNWLDACRSKRGKLDGEVIHYQKFSSMGNGFTFDLESLIFWAMSMAVVKRLGYNTFWVNVMGDDIIVPSACFDEVSKALEAVGFLVNRTKSFSTGPFRESCGGDYFLGLNVRSVYLKKVPTSEVDWLKLANRIRLLAHQWCDGYGCDIRLKLAYDFCISRLTPRLRKIRVPNGYGDDAGVISNLDEASPLSLRGVSGWDGWLVGRLSSATLSRSSTNRSLVVAGTFQLTQHGNELPLRGGSLYRETRSFVASQWTDLGPWL
jgi:hypothetical protein